MSSDGQPPAPEADKAEKDKALDKEAEAALQQERDDAQKRDEAIEASWTKKVLAKGSGPVAWKGARASVHLVGRVVKTGETIEDTRARGEPLLLLLGRSTVVPGLDRALMAMQAGEKARITVEPAGGYGAAGSIAYPRVPGSATLVYEAEVLRLDKEEDLWELSFDAKMALADERRERGNRLFRRGHFKEADDEYEQSMRYIVFMPHPSEAEGARIAAFTLALQLNQTASKLRCGYEDAAIKHANKALELQPEHPKALYRLGQAHTQLGQFEKARAYLRRAEEAAEGDEAVAGSVKRELSRLQERKERHTRQQKAAYRRMIDGDAGQRGGSPPARAWRSLAASPLWRRLGLEVALVVSCIVGLMAWQHFSTKGGTGGADEVLPSS